MNAITQDNSNIDLMTQVELAQLLGVKRNTLREWRRLKRGPAYIRILKGVFYRRTDVNAWLDANKFDPTTT